MLRLAGALLFLCGAVVGIPLSAELGVDAEAQVDPLAHASMCELIQVYAGYPCERHDIKTDDGYILGAFRMANPGKPAIILQHGFVDSSTTWVMNDPQQSLGFLAFDAGFDVWFGNSRGNGYSLKAEFCNDCSKSDQFWQFTWDDMARYDVPALVDYVRGETKQDKITWVGHSQGTTQMFAALSQQTDLASKLHSFIALAPVAYIGHPQGTLLKALGKIDPRLVPIVLGNKIFPPANDWLAKLFPPLCALTPNLCANTIFSLVGGGDSQQLNRTRLPIYTGHTPQTTSIENLIHWSEAMSSDKFQFFDFGSAEKNKEHYNVTSPPQYDVTRISVPIAIFNGDLDFLADPTDVAQLVSELPSATVHQFHYPNFNHMDFVWGVNVTSVLYQPLLDFARTNL